MPAAPAPAPRKRAPKKPAEPKPEPPTNAAWNGYAAAYRARYGADPVRNASVNGKLAGFVAKIPAAEVAEVAAYFVGHGNTLYVRAGHPVDLLLRDAEKLRTEWFTNRPIVDTPLARPTRPVDAKADWKAAMSGRRPANDPTNNDKEIIDVTARRVD